VHVVATAGHVDHGKSTLVLGLTGTDPDRWAEEKERGLTIDLGFAWTSLPSGREVAFVDVPGHLRFLKNMLAGVGAVDACLFVVAATEGWKPQSEEHLRILEVLGITRGVVALTKVGPASGAGADPGLQARARAQLEERLAGSFLAGAEVVAVDVPAGRGRDDLCLSLDRLLATTPTARDRGRPRLWVDRVFPIRGAGTVVTGTLVDGPLEVGQEVELHPSGPGGTAESPRPARIRGLQTHHQARDRITPGHRAAVNLAGIPHDRLARGHVLVRPGQWEPTRTFDAELTVLGTLGHDVARRGAYLAYLGSGEHAVGLRVLGPAPISAGSSGLVRMHLPVALPLLPGDCFVLRESGRSETVGGGVVLDVDPVLPAGRARPDRSVERVVAERGRVEADRLERLTGIRLAPHVGPWVVDPAVLERDIRALRQRAAGAGPSGLDPARLDDWERALVAHDPQLALENGRVVRPGDTAVDAGLRPGRPAHPWLDRLEEEAFSPPPPEGVDRVLLRQWVQTGAVVERDGIYFSAGAVGRASLTVARLLASRPEGVTPSDVARALGTSRKYVMPLLGHLDATGVTRRRGSARIGGPRLPAPGATGA
jgi:selenocysteine-specific elongation factor